MELIGRLSHPSDEMIEGVPGIVVTLTPGSIASVDRKVITAAEFERLSPTEQDQAFEASIIWDLADAPPELVARARARVEERIAREERQSRE